MTSEYSTVQKLSLAGMVVGSIMCIVAVGSPYWVTSDPQGFAELDLLGKVVKGSLGMFMYCVEVMGEKECKIIDASEDSGWFHTCQVAASGCVLLSAICGLTSLCLACCHCCRRLIILGIVTFIAAASGALSVGVFTKHTESFTGSIYGFQMSSYGWAYFLWIAGVALLGVVSFASCFSAPENPLRGVILRQGGGGPQVIVASSTNTSTTTNPYMHLQEQGGPVMMPGGTVSTGSSTAVCTNGY